MPVFLIALLWVGVVAWLILRAARQGASYQVAQPVRCGVNDEAPRLAVIVPARNEAHNLERCLWSLLQQDYPAHAYEIRVVDDNSSDDTAAIVRRMAALDRRVRLLEGQALPEGWTGKAYACWQGSHSVAAEWLMFVDADTVAQPALLQTAVAIAQTHRLDLLSLEPFQELGSVWERLVIPIGLLALAFSQDLRRVNDPTAPDATANGQCLFFRQAVYTALGGHAAVRDAICEDSALARVVKRSGARVAVLGAEGLIRTRMYTGGRSLWEGLSKNVTEMLGGVGPTTLLAGAGLLLGWLAVLLPWWMVSALGQPHASSWQAWAAGAALSGSLALASLHLGVARYCRIPFWYGCLFPVGYTVGALIALNAVRQRLRGRVVWKGRWYTPPRRTTPSAEL